jgi:hypothetical protein
MNHEWDGERQATKGRLRYRDTLRMLRGYLRPVEPDPGFSRHLEELCESMGARELFQGEGEKSEEGGHRGIVIGGAIFSALPFLGVAAYAIRKHLLRRRVLPVGI